MPHPFGFRTDGPDILINTVESLPDNLLPVLILGTKGDHPVHDRLL